HLKDDQTTSLSDGERQLVSIARALAHETPYLFLDEPTAFLDFFHRKNVLALLKEIAQVKKIGIILSTHELDLVVNLNLPLILVSKGGTILHHPSIANRQALENLLS
ncbi:MAG: ATP-binding cassette domain-containing protein, partial [Flavobacteriales bacterium]